ncbi:EF-hand domain-containing protein D1 isoform X5 [Oryzias melastigma]|uniref:EF-hand domain-containing protein D1 isoform X5 n=1 Tax=Oryzias melastigma TaxID=30732 RepID=UPI000CF8000B|nr:EF-hand domain-containing protein D1 isoform X5 [Oryzias melastigma]
MASEELAKKLQSRFAAVEDTENRLEPELSPARSAPREPIGGEDCSELSAMLHRRLDINDGAAAPCATRVFNPYTEFKEFSRRQIKDMEAMFRRYDMGKDGFIDLMELKLMMEKLGAPQTHLGLKNMIREVDEDFDGKLSFREVELPQAAVTLCQGGEQLVQTEGRGLPDQFKYFGEDSRVTTSFLLCGDSIGGVLWQQ